MSIKNTSDPQKMHELKRFESLTFEDFRHMATDPSLSRYERIGFPESYREGKESSIFADIKAKLAGLTGHDKVILDIGPGCSELPEMLIGLCETQGHQLLLVDSEEMLAQLPDKPFIKKIPAYYPECGELFAEFTGSVDVILVYSVFHYVFAEGNVWRFLDKSLQLLNSGGEMLIGDIPNISKRRRFFSSPAGVAFHQAFTGTDSLPDLSFNAVEPDKIDDSVVFAILSRVRAQGFDAYVVPQGNALPMANRREDIYIRKP